MNSRKNCRTVTDFGGSDIRLAGKGPEPTTIAAPSAQGMFLPGIGRSSSNPEDRKTVGQKVETSGRALPEVSEAYQKAAKEFIGYLESTLDDAIT